MAGSAPRASHGLTVHFGSVHRANAVRRRLFAVEADEGVALLLEDAHLQDAAVLAERLAQVVFCNDINYRTPMFTSIAFRIKTATLNSNENIRLSNIDTRYLFNIRKNRSYTLHFDITYSFTKNRALTVTETRNKIRQLTGRIGGDASDVYGSVVGARLTVNFVVGHF